MSNTENKLQSVEEQAHKAVNQSESTRVIHQMRQSELPEKTTLFIDTYSSKVSEVLVFYGVYMMPVLVLKNFSRILYF